MIYGGPVGGTTPWVNVKGQDGYGWAGGAERYRATRRHSLPAAALLPMKHQLQHRFDDRLFNATYGAGNWTITNPTLTFASANFVQNNSRFGVGGGGFNIYYVANNQWGQSEAGTGGTYSPNPIYADGINQSATAAQKTLNTWAGSSSLLGTKTYSTTGGRLEQRLQQYLDKFWLWVRQYWNIVRFRRKGVLHQRILQPCRGPELCVDTPFSPPLPAAPMYRCILWAPATISG